jgi:subtilisin
MIPYRTKSDTICAPIQNPDSFGKPIPTGGTMIRHPRFALALQLGFILLCLTGTAQVIEAAPPGKVDVLIGFKKAPTPQDEAFIRRQGGKVNHSYTLVDAVAASVPQQALIALANRPNVTVIEPDVEVHAIGHEDAELAAAWGVDRIESGYAHHLDPAITGKQVKVAVIDTGVDIDHPELAANYKGGWDFVNNDSNPDDDNGHGTHCAGTIAAASNGVGVVGVAPEVDIYAYKVLNESGSGSFSDVIAALEKCVIDGIHVTSNSYGSSQNPGGIVEQAFINAEQAGILNVAAAGNNGNFNGKGNKVGYPARYSSVMAVAATDENDQRAYFSSTGPDLEVSAPGYSILSTYPDGGYAYASGTSMACPHVSGMAALLIQAGLDAGQEIDNFVVRQVLLDSCEDLGANGFDEQYGYGIVNAMMGIELIVSGILPPAEEPPAEPPSGTETMTVDSIEYSTTGGKFSDLHLFITLHVADSSGAGVPNASVDITLNLDGSPLVSGSGSTDSSGYVTFKLTKAPSGIYTTDVTGVTANGYEWDSWYPDNVFVK